MKANQEHAQPAGLTAPDGTRIEVSRNHGKPNDAARIAAALKKGKRQSDPTPLFPPTLATQAAPATTPTADANRSPPPAASAAPPQASGIPTEMAPTGPVPGTSTPRRAKKQATARAAPATSPANPSPATATDPATEGAVNPAPAGSVQAPATDANPEHAARRTMQVRFTGMKPMHVVEAALFSAGKPVGVEEIAESTGLPPDSVKAGIRELVKAYEERDTVLEVGKAGTKWGMQVKQQAAEPAAKFAPMEIPAKVLKTLALIAYHQPLKQSELADMIGSKVYDHVPELVSRGLVKAKEEGVTKILVTTSAFPEYFGLDAANPQEIRATMARLVGIDPTKAVAPVPATPEPDAAAVEPDGAKPMEP